MKSVLKPARSPFPPESIERMLSRYYPQLVEWSLILARGDHAAAEESVQDLCLYLTLSQPDLSGVHNLDNYLFTCLRNMYVSNLARVSRERLRVIQVEDYDAVGIVAASGGLDTVDVQNELLRICDYVLSRKYVSKSASHFILHFFLGYRRSDIALLARLPIAAIYNKLKEIRSDLREYLSAGEKIRLVRRNAMPERKPLRTAIASDVFLKELRSSILDADSAICMTEAELANAYMQPGASPVNCQELAHLAGCERCLTILERILHLNDHDGPLDGIEDAPPPKKEEKKSSDATMRMVRKRREQIMERRPGLLAIAVDGSVVAFHAVESAHNSLSSRVDVTATMRFIEVFNEFGDRLAHIPLDMGAVFAPVEQLSQQVLLSDDRRLRLNVNFDGLGIHAEVDYVDPALALIGAEEEEQPYEHKASVSFWQRLQLFAGSHFAPWGVAAFTSLLFVVTAGIAGYRYKHPGWLAVLARAQATVQAPLPGETLHQVLRIEESMGPEQGTLLGTVDVWRDSNRQVARRLYNAQQKLLATSTDAEDGTRTVNLENEATTQKDRQLIESGVWQSDVTTAAFAASSEKSVEAYRNENGFEVTKHEDGRNGVLSRTLVLDSNYQVQAEQVRYQVREGVFEVRLVQTLLHRVPNRDVPAGTFAQPHELTAPGKQSERNFPTGPEVSPAGDAAAVNLEVAVLYALFQQNVDTGQPIDVSATADGRVHMTGTLANAKLLAEIRKKIGELPNAGQVDFHIYSTSEATSAVSRGKAIRQEIVGDDNDAPASGPVRNALLARGLKDAALRNAEQEFSASALSHAQVALQHAYALDRLGAILQRGGQSSLGIDARLKWSQMVERHSAIALGEFGALHLQLDSIAAGIAIAPSVVPNTITDANTFVHAASELRKKAQLVNEQVVELFAGSAANVPAAQVSESIIHLQTILPVAEANRMRSFASRLTNRNAPGQNDVGEIHPH